ncbi:MAG: toll/interleukin-1 receptor domain-containing protein, partial [Saprospiraceae bacterium]
MPDIFISYRRSDCQSEAFALHQALLLHFSPEQVFLDTSRIEPGAVWSDRLTAAVQESKVMLVLIGPKWLKAQDEESGTRRLDDPEDWVRREVGTGLSSETLVIPLLFNKAAMPKAAYLPPPLQELPDRQYRELRAGEWPSDLAWVLETIGQRVERRAENNTATSPSIRNRQLTPPPPAPPPHFTGREADLTALHESLAGPGKSCLLLTCGTGGIGKTTLATAYYSQYGDQDRHCAWVECPTENALNGLVDSALGTLFKSPDAGRDFPSDRLQRFRQEGPEPIRSEESPQKRFQRIRQGLAGLEGPNLLIIDNANDPESIREIYPELVLPNWSVLVTTRAELPEFPHRNVYSLPKDEARNYFCSLYAPAVREPELLDELLERTGCHTLTLEVLAKTLATQPGYSFPKLMEDLRRRGLPGIIRSTTAAIGWRNRKVAKTSTPAELLRIVFDVARLSGAERDLLTAWAILPSVHISYEQLRAI